MKFNKVTKSLALVFGTIASQNAVAEMAFEESLEKIVVSGQKIDRSLKETVNSVGVMTNADLEKMNVQNIADVYNFMPNVSGDFSQGFTIRGINAFNVSGGGNSFLTSMYLDGAPLPYRVVRSGAVSVWDLSQVEVFRGPQSTLQGRNALAGAIMLRTQDPTYEYSAKGRVTIGDHGQQEFAAAGGGALVDDMLAFRLSFEDKEFDGDIDNVTRGDESSFEENQTIRGKLLFEPTDNIDALLTVSNSDVKHGPQWSLFEHGDSPFDREVWYNSFIYETTDTDIYNLEVSWEINDQWSFDSITTYSDSEYRYNWDGDLTAEQIVEDNAYVKVDKTFSQEFRFTYQTDDIQAVTGAYFSSLEVDDHASGERFLSFADLGLPSLDVLLTAPPEFGGFGLPAEYAALVVPLYPDIDPVILGLDSSVEQEVDTFAIYADVTWKINDQFDLLTGIRYDEEEQKNGNYANYSINNTMPDPTLVPAPLDQIVAGINGTLHGLAASASGVEPLEDADFDAWLPKLGVSYHASEDVTASLVYQKGYRSGGVGTNIARQEVYTYDAEYTDNYELSIRSVWQEGKLMWNTNVFYMDWTDQQVTLALSDASFDTISENAGESTVKGFETEVFYYPTDQLTVTGGLGLAKTEFEKYPSKPHLVGRSFEDSPEWTANFVASYDFGNGLNAGLNVNYRDESDAYIDPQATLEQQKLDVDADPKNESRVLVNANVSYEWDNYTVRIDAANLLDKEYINYYFTPSDDQGLSDSYGQHQIGRSRQVSVSFLAEF